MGVTVIVPIFICVVLPVAIVWIVFYSTTQKNRMQTQIVLEAIKANPEIDAEKIIMAMRAKKRGPWERLNRKLLRGCIFTLIGVAFAIMGACSPELQDDYDCWVVCAVCGSVGIAFLITYWFAYRHINQLTAELENEEKIR